MQKLVDSGIPLHKALAMGMDEGVTGHGYENMMGTKGKMPMVKDDMGKEEKGIGSKESSKY